ncbi:hypothetical protein [Pseudomonas benzenivorans]|uniref:hypothetical protein n=1 Tax=Pseudomonas benzenivorans TaxID=556533 RepID=UPI003512C7F7
MDNSTWTSKEKCLSAFWLLCAAAIAVTIYVQASEMAASTVLQSLGLFVLVVSWALSPGFFLQPLKRYTSKPIRKPLVLGVVALFAFQLASVFMTYAA